MIKEAIAEAATIPAAVEAAKKALGVSDDAEVKFEVLTQPQKKTLGLFGGCKAKVRAYVEESAGSAAALEYLKKILELMGLSIDTACEETEGGCVITLTGPDVGAVIGHHGETLDALQYLTGLACNKGSSDYYRVQINSGNYRQKREDSLVALAKSIAAKAVKNERNYTLEPMNPYERRIIHTAVQGIDGVTSWSTGDGNERRVVIGTDKDDDSRTTVYRRERREGDRRSGGRGGDRRGRDRRPRRDSYSPAADSAREKKTEHDDVALFGRIN